VLRTAKGVHFEDELLWRRDGTSFPAEFWCYPQLRGKEVVGAVEAFVDLTQRKQAEDQAAALRQELAHLGRVAMVDALTGSLAHEINQPLTAVMANAEAALRLLARQPIPMAEVREALKEIVGDNRLASAVLQRTRALLKKGVTEHGPVEVNATIEDVVRLIRRTATSRGIAVEVELDRGLGPIVGDRVQVQQVALNLLMNAFDAVQGLEGPRRRVILRTASRDGAAVVEVRDRGPGISDRDVARLFEPFFTTKPDGLGMGLSISRAIVEAHGGTIVAVRNPDQGLTVSASFPTARTAQADQSARLAGAQVQP
jgi:two-component system sensor kinase FixL